jgi:hypothetical protein
METKTCPGCGKEKTRTEFNFRNKEKGLRQRRCRECTRQQVRSHYRAHQSYYLRKARLRNKLVEAIHRQKVLKYLADHPCVDCGETDPCCLDFDHVRGTKRSDVSRMLGDYGWETILEEINKCDVRCASSHRKRTAERRNAWRHLPTR